MPGFPPDPSQPEPSRRARSQPEPSRRARRRAERRRVSTEPPPPGIAGFAVRATRVAGRFPKTVLVLWLALIAACVYAGSVTGMRQVTDADTAVGDSGRADAAITRARLDGHPTESVLVRGASRAQTDAAAAPLGRRIARLPQVRGVDSPYPAGGGTAELRSPKTGAVLLQVELRGDDDAATDNAKAVSRAVEAARRAHPGVTFAQAGAGSVEGAIDDIVADDLSRAEVLSLPVTLLVLILAFGAIVAASVPLALGVTAVAGAMGALGVISQVVPNDDSTGSLVVLIGLAVGVDYSLFYVRREREERRAGASPQQALERAAASVGRAIIVAGTTVMAALAGLFLSGFAPFRSMAAGTVLVVAIAVLGSLTVLPAMLALLGDRIDAGRIIGRRRARREARQAERAAARVAGGQALASAPGVAASTGRPSPLGRFVGAVARRPLPALIVALAALLALAYPAASMRLGQGGMESLPKGVPAIDAMAKIDAAFGGSSTATLVVTGHDLRTPAARSGLSALAAEAANTTGVHGYAPVTISQDGSTAKVEVPLPDQSPAASQQLVKDLRSALDGRPGDLVPGASNVYVGGDAAGGLDFRDRVVRAMPVVVGFVLGLALLLLLATFRSLPLALTVVALNLLSVAAAYGVITAVFQHTWAEGLLGFTSNGSVTTWLPLLAFVILFGLSMDYSVLVLERIREARAAGLPPREAAAAGVSATAGTVTSAAVVMVAVFSIFALLRLLEMKQLGVGLATAILVDATIVRAIALPAAVALLGDRAFPHAGGAPRSAANAARTDQAERAARAAAAHRPASTGSVGGVVACDDGPMAQHPAVVAGNGDA